MAPNLGFRAAMLLALGWYWLRVHLGTAIANAGIRMARFGTRMADIYGRRKSSDF